MEKTVFEYRDYKKYLADALASKQGRGLRSRLAEALNCQPAFISRVLNNSDAQFSQEHGMLISRFLEHGNQEAHYFMLLLHYGRAGSKLLEAYYLKQIQEVEEKRLVIADRIQVKLSLNKEDQMTYYSAWYYSAIHIALMVPDLQTKTAIATYLKLPAALVSECLDFLASVGLAEVSSGKYKVGSKRIHLSKESPMISKHHTNWRMKAIQVFERKSNEDLHFSGPMCISQEDSLKIKESILKTLEEIEPVIKASKEESVFCLSLDFFRV